MLTTCSSGIRVGAWEYLKWKHIEPIRRVDKVVAAKIIVMRGKTSSIFHLSHLKRLRPLKNGWSIVKNLVKTLTEKVG